MQTRKPAKQLLKTFWKRFKRYLVIYLLAVAFFLVFNFISYYYQISSFEIEGEDNLKIKGLNSFLNKNILFLSHDEVEKTLLAQNPAIKIIKVDKIIPNRLKIEYRLEEIYAAIKVSDGYFLLGENGKIISKIKKDSQDYPVISYYQKFIYSSFNTGDKIEYLDLKTSLALLKFSLNLGLKIDTIDINGTNMIAFGIDKKRILFTMEKEAGKQQYELETIIRQYKIEGKEFKTLDLRFDKPVVKF